MVKENLFKTISFIENTLRQKGRISLKARKQRPATEERLKKDKKEANKNYASNLSKKKYSIGLVTCRKSRLENERFARKFINERVKQSLKNIKSWLSWANEAREYFLEITRKVNNLKRRQKIIEKNRLLKKKLKEKQKRKEMRMAFDLATGKMKLYKIPPDADKRKILMLARKQKFRARRKRVKILLP